MDLDFYCHRPFHCLDHLVADKAAKMQLGSNQDDILAVSLEPCVHANIFRNKERVVIQDFYMATPKHPFFKWFLDQRLAVFLKDPTHPTKGPFSYSIEVDIDAYHAALGEAEKGQGQGKIIELREDILHSLVDSSNSRLKKVCSTKPLAPMVEESCKVVNADKYFRPTDDTIAVHMWTHTYLGWNFIRGAYNSALYYKVESSLPSTFNCPPFHSTLENPPPSSL